MLFETKYQILGRVNGDERGSLFRAKVRGDNRDVILKFPTRAQRENNMGALKHEYNISRQLNGKGIPRYLQVETFHLGSVAVIENVEGELFDFFLHYHKLDVESLLRIAISIVEILELLHRHSIVHQDICPVNFIINPETLEMNLLDLSQAVYSNVEDGGNPGGFPSSDLAYISPEQTGRLTDGVDIRSDLYSFGVILYQMFTGQVPFEKDEALSVIHQHIAKNPAPPHELNPRIPLTISRIVLKLLAKNLRQRYQSPSGLKLDLIECLNQWSGNGTIELFELGKQDFSGTLQEARKFYGRDKEMAVLLESFHEARAGGAEVVLIEGHSGIGKSALAGQMKTYVKTQHVNFIEGKFDQYQLNIPYFGFIQAFRSLADFILSQGHERIAYWRQWILKEIGDNGRVLTDVIPHLELLLGPQPELPDLELNETENRFNYVFGKFIKCLAQKDHPLVIFFDDVQWADAASASLIKYLLANQDLRYYLFIGASRIADGLVKNPFRAAMQDLQKLNFYFRHLLLLPLSTDDIVQIVLETLGDATSCDERLIRSVEERSQGNPFIIKVLLNCLYAEKVIGFDFVNKKWELDASRMSEFRFSEDIVEMMTGRLNQLPATTRNLVKMAACIGYRFDLRLLAILMSEPKGKVIETLLPAIREGLLFENGEIYRFTHDRIQQAAYALIPTTERKRIHLAIGQTLVEKAELLDAKEYVFEIPNQLNEGRELITSFTQRGQLAALNLEAGIKAKSSAAYKTSLGYFTIGVELLGSDKWRSSYSLTLQLHIEGGEAALLAGEYQLMDGCIEAVLHNATNQLDKLRAYETKIKYYIAAQRLLEAVETSLEALSLLEITFPASPTKFHVLAALVRIRTASVTKPAEALFNLPPIANKSAEAAIRLLTIVGSAVYFAKPDLFPLFVCKAFSLMLKYGKSPYSGVVTASYSIILLGGLGDIEGGYRYGKTAVRLCANYEISSFRYQCTLIIHNFILHWKEPLKSILGPLKANYWNCLETGNTEFAALSAELYCFNAFFCGSRLKELAEEMLDFHANIEQLKQETSMNLHKIHTQMVLNLVEEVDDPLKLTGRVHDEDVMLKHYEAAKAENLLFDAYLCKTILCYLFGDFRQAEFNAKQALVRIDSVLATPEVIVFLFYSTLTALALYEADKLRVIRRNIGRMEKYARFAPVNCEHKLLLLRAEFSRATGDARQAMEYYDKAIELAERSGFINDLALAYELAGRFYKSLEKDLFAAQYILLAYKHYQEWGATIKARFLETEYPYAFEQGIFSGSRLSPVVERGTEALLLANSHGGALDLGSIMKAAVAISAEIEFEKLIRNLIRIAVENAGAQQGYLILVQENSLYVRAQASVNGDVSNVSQPLETMVGDAIPAAIVKFVYLTKEDLVIGDVAYHAHFSMDAMVRKRNSKSILCLPILLQGEVIAMLYFEHNLIANAFQANRIEVLKLLSGQMAISLRNAMNEQKKIAEEIERERLIARIHIQEQELLKTKLEIQEQTLNNISTEIHDNIGQTLSFVKLNLATINPAQPEVARERLAETTGVLTKAIQDLRDLAKTLNTDFIGKAGLAKAIEVQLEFLKKTGLFRTQVIVTGGEEKYDAQRELVVFRVVQELLNNAVKHAAASAIIVTIDYNDDGLSIVVKDDGKGFDLAGQALAGTGGLGLNNIQNRVSLIKGRVNFESSPGAGSTMSIAIDKD